MSLLDWLMSKVDDDGKCWLWTGPVSPAGYGYLTHQGQSLRAHRFAYELVNGPVPDGLVLDHLCRVRRCVNPAHLEAVTQRVNLMRSPATRAARRLLSTCARGHEFDAANTYTRRNGTRLCRECARLRRLAAAS